MGKGRPSKYHSHVEPHLSEIADMAERMTEAQIADSLGVSYTQFREMKKKYPILSDSLKKGRKTVVERGRSALIKRAEGYDYEEKKTIVVKGKVIREEITKKHCPPDVAAINLLLKNYDPDNWANDPQMIKIRQEELALAREKMERSEYV